MGLFGAPTGGGLGRALFHCSWLGYKVQTTELKPLRLDIRGSGVLFVMSFKGVIVLLAYVLTNLATIRRVVFVA